MARKTKNNDQEAYYTLRAVHATGGSAHNRQLMAGADTIHIGQTTDCEWHFDNTTNYIDEVYAVIRPGQISGEWVLVPTSEHVGVSVNGTKVDLIHYLRDGDIISFDGERQELRFNVHHDGRYSADIGVVYIPARTGVATKAGIVLTALLIVGIVCLWAYINFIAHHDDRINVQLESNMTAVFQITVDTIDYVASIPGDDGTRRDSLVGRYIYTNQGKGEVSGTAFMAFTSDGTLLLITARHCIEPWLNDPTINRVARPSDIQEEGPVRWAFEAETAYQLTGIDSLRLVSHCTIWGGETGTSLVAHCTLDDFQVDRDFDDIVPKGDFYEDYYWRSISMRGRLTRQALGDVAWMPIEMPYSCDAPRLADSTYMKDKLNRGRDLYFLGYPQYQSKGFETQCGTLKKAYAEDELLWHDGNITHGYSGGPVMVIEDQWGSLTATVVGVVSLADSIGTGRTYSVPVTNIKFGEENEE